MTATRRPLVIILAAVVGSFGAGLGFAVTASQADAEFASRVRAYLQNRAARSAFSAAILVASKGEVVIREAYGMADFELGVPLRPDHVFRIGSLTKPFTATAILRLRDQGRLELSRSVCDFVRPCPAAWRSVTIAHLLSHTSGIPDRFGDLEAVPAPATRAEVDRVLGKAGALALNATAGSQYSYSNFNYVLLGYIIEAVTGETWEAFLLAQLLTPAGTADTRYDDVWSVVPRRVHGYEVKDGQLRITRYTDHAAYAAGGLRSTVDDLRRWHDEYWAGSILSKASVAEALRTGLGDYGYGWQVTTHFGRPVHNHTGGLRGFASHLAFYPNQELLIVILSNIENENTKGTACDIAALALKVAPVPTGTPEWIQRSNDERCGARRP
ncbi:MAG: beta-lactamase family protein [Acidobacteria bacterium]|nr:beta-lactamase family protein [Acidobacteriota bacterium]